MSIDVDKLRSLYGKHNFKYSDEEKVVSKPSSGYMCINCDTHGFGDIMTMAWIAEGAKDSNTQIELYATGNKRHLLEILNHKVPDDKTNALLLDKIFPYDQEWIKKHNYSRIDSWLQHFGLEGIKPKRPTYTLSQQSIDYAAEICDSNTIVLCPESIRPNRQWPNCNWIELQHILQKKGHKVLVICYRGLYFKDVDNSINNLSWNKLFAIFERCKLVVGNDSAPIHAAGITNTKAIALLGPTTDHVFQHLENVKSISISKEEMPCVGCWFYEEYTPDPCDCGCVALCSITPKQVCKNILEMLDNE